MHGGFDTAGSKGRSRGLVHHCACKTVFASVARMSGYTSLEFSYRLRRNQAAGARWSSLPLSPLSHCLRRFIVKGGWRDGFQGFLLAPIDATYVMLLYAKLWEYWMRQHEGKGLLPPITNRELNSVKLPR